MSDSAHQSKKPVWAVTGLAILAAAVIAFLTKGQWSPDRPQAVATEQQAPAGTAETKTAEQPAAPAATTAEQPAAPAETGQQQTAAAEQPAAPVPAEQPAAPASAGQPAAPATQQTAEAAATADEPAQQSAPAAETTEQQASAPAAAAAQEQPSAPAQTASQETTTQQTTAPASETTTQQQQASAPAAEQPPAPAAAEMPAKTDAPAKPDAVVPAFDTVRVEKTGEAVIAGTAAANSEVVVKFDGAEIGKTTANEDGAFVIVPDAPLPSGSGELTIEAKGKGDLNAVASTQTVAVIVPAAETKQEALVAVVSPDQPTRILQKPAEAPETQTAATQPAEASSESSTTVAKTPAAAAKPVSIDAVDYDGAGNIVFSGDGTPGQTARIYVDNNFLADAPIGADGRWSFSGTADVKSGVHQLRVDAIDPAGKVANRIEVPFFREDQTKIAAATQPADQTVAKTTEQGTTAAPAASGASDSSQTAAATATGEAAQPQAPKEGRVVIQPGNNLWRISRVLYGNGQKYTMLYQANKDQIRNPNRIYPGQVFKTPEVAPKMESIDPNRRDPLKPEENAATQN